MTIQILSIVLYSHDGRSRSLKLLPGRVNIITGASKSGKSALTSIVDYCFSSSKCRVPEGPIRRNVSWFGLKLKLPDGEAFIARRCPGPNTNSSEDCFIKSGNNVEIPEFDELHQTTNTRGISSLLSGWCGITDNIHEPPPGQKRPALSATIRHALALCIQQQDEIIRKEQLFHGADDTFAALALRDTLPYFLGAVDDDNVRKREKLKNLKEELRQFERRLSEIKMLQSGGAEKSNSLLAQARDIGLTSSNAAQWHDVIAELKKIDKTPITKVKISPDSVGREFNKLTLERQKLLDEHNRMRDEIELARSFENDEKGFSSEAAEQQARLRTLEIFSGSNPHNQCPLCEQDLHTSDNFGKPLFQESLSQLSSRIDSVTRARPKIENAISEIEKKLKDTNQKLALNRAAMEAVRAQSERINKIHDDQARRAHILGKISLYLESLPEIANTSDIEININRLKLECKNLEGELSNEIIEDRLTSISSILSTNLSKWAKQLQLEHSEFPLRFDFKKLTLVADTPDGGVPMENMGSGENWVGYHLIAHLALHQWFVKRKRPVPRFLFLDQPSQVYFPPEPNADSSLKSIPEDDRAAVARMFKLIVETINAEKSKLQVIITEHADLQENWYQSSIVERWRGGLKLVPDDWPRGL